MKVQKFTVSIGQLSQKWTSPIYVFFKPTPRIEYKDGRACHIFECDANRCKGKNGRDVRRFLDKGDANSTGNLRKHAKMCWGDEAVETAYATKDLDAARKVLIKSTVRDGSISAQFERIGKSKVTFSHREHTTTESRYLSLFPCFTIPDCCFRAEIVRWVSESKRPFEIVKDRGFVKLMKTGRPHIHIPSPSTVSRDVKNVFVHVCKRIAKMLQVTKLLINSKKKKNLLVCVEY
jgi:hypothetical protein